MGFPLHEAFAPCLPSLIQIPLDCQVPVHHPHPSESQSGSLSICLRKSPLLFTQSSLRSTSSCLNYLILHAYPPRCKITFSPKRKRWRHQCIETEHHGQWVHSHYPAGVLFHLWSRMKAGCSKGTVTSVSVEQH